jgi:hypothetical protein
MGITTPSEPDTERISNDLVSSVQLGVVGIPDGSHDFVSRALQDKPILERPHDLVLSVQLGILDPIKKEIKSMVKKNSYE